MRYLLYILVLFTACTKKPTGIKSSRIDFFTDNTDAFKKVQLALHQHNIKEQLILIENITYIDAVQKSFAFVFYRSNMGLSNVVFQLNHNPTAKEQVTSIKCDGEDCDCKVKTIITSTGDVTVDCTCKSCTMLINQNIYKTGLSISRPDPFPIPIHN